MQTNFAADFSKANAQNNRQKIDVIRTQFVSHFSEQGFIQVPAEPLIPQKDKTVLYSNATITPIKEHLLAGQKPENGWVIDQPCLRIQNLSRYSDSQFDPEYMSFFHMVGVYVAKKDCNFIGSILRVLDVLGLSKDRLEIHGCHRDTDLLDAFTDLEPSIVRRQYQQDEGYFDWKYDMPGYRGRGVHIMIVQDRGPALSVGQLVEIRNCDEVIGYEFGFGVETFLARLNQEHSIFDLGIGREFFPQSTSNADRQYQDLLASSMAMHCAGTKTGKNGRSAAFRKAISQLAIIELQPQGLVFDDRTKEIIYNQVSRSAGHGSIDRYLDILRRQKCSLEERMKRYATYTRERLLQVQKGEITAEYAEGKIVQYANKVALPDKMIRMTEPKSSSVLHRTGNLICTVP